jgi:hypothetical protein
MTTKKACTECGGTKRWFRGCWDCNTKNIVGFAAAFADRNCQTCRGTGIVWRRCRACGNAGCKPPETVTDELSQQFREILFTTDHHLRPGSNIEVAVSWPVLLTTDLHLRLVALGRVVRSEEGTAAMEISRYEFRNVQAPDASSSQF